MELDHGTQFLTAVFHGYRRNLEDVPGNMNKKRLTILCLFVAALVCITCGRGPGGTTSITLYDNWEFKHPDSTAWRSAAVPGSIQNDLLLHGLIPDPFFADNEKLVSWVGDSPWEYRCTFSLPREVARRDRIELVFEGLDTYASVMLNGRQVLAADNMFRTWRIDVTGIARAGENELSILFEPVSAIEEAKMARLGHELPGGGRVFTRKAAFHYGWDWSPVILTAGIWRPAAIEAWDAARIRSLYIEQAELTPRAARLNARFEIESILPDTRARLSIADVEREIELRPGTHQYIIEFEIADPKRWWPNGAGEPHLYELEGTLAIGGRVIDSRRERIGLRTIELVTEPDNIGSSFRFDINGRPLFIKGANYIPQDNLQSRVTPAQYRRMIDAAAGAHMNMLRVWGGGIYEDDPFYDLCDENGILVWQDFMFACAMYPGDSAFAANVEGEIVDTVKRLRNHPSIALWCGNNEISEGWHRWGWQDGFTVQERSEIRGNYERLFGELIPRIVDSLTYADNYWESSPQFGRGDPRHQNEGDAHYWGVWHDAEPFEMFDRKVPRFMSEFGFQSFPEMASIERFVPDSMRYRDSPALWAHQKHPRGFSLIDEYIGREYRAPKDFESLVYLSQVVQAEGIARGIEAHRRARPRCMGTLYWQLNDCWPAVSWSSIDYYGRWKALHYFVKRAYEDVLLSFEREGDLLHLYSISDSSADFECEIHCSLMDFNGAALWDTLFVRTIESGASALIHSVDLRRFANRDLRALLLAASLRSDGNKEAMNTYLFDSPAHLALPDPGLTYTILPADDGYRILVRSDRLAKYVYLRYDVDGFFSDNYFDLSPGEEKEIVLHTDKKLGGRSLRITSLRDSYRE